jgi:opacity protein-like surface antigen
MRAALGFTFYNLLQESLMRPYFLAAAAAVAASTPAVARDGAPYGGIEGGLIFDGKADMDVEATIDSNTFDINDAVEIGFKRGADIDVIAGYDFGMVRAEAEFGYKHLRVKDFDLANALIGTGDFGNGLDASGSATVWSLMGNALLDFGGNEGVGAYVGGGIGPAHGKYRGESGTALAWQILAGVRMPVSSNVDVGLKYRYFNSQKLEFSDSFDGGEFGIVDIDARGKLQTHSLLLSLIYNFAPPAAPEPAAPPAAPPPPPPPATQTCPDGSVILTTDICPASPSVPPPPPVPPSAGERG